MERLASLSDEALLHDLHAIVGSHRRVTAELIVHLGEVDARRLHVDKGFSSLFSYCVEVLNFSEDEACRRIEAARLTRRFPAIHALLQTGAVSLTVLGLLKSRLTDANHRELLAGVARSSVRQAKEWIAARFPEPDVPSTIRKQSGRRPLLVIQPPPAAASASPMASISRMASVSPAASVSQGASLPLTPSVFPTGEAPKLAERIVRAASPEPHEAANWRRTNRPQEKPRPAKDTQVTCAARREVVARDGWRCSFVADDGRRCEARRFLEFDHETPKGRGGSSRAKNLRLLCRSHNRLAAELYGKEHVSRAISASRGETRRVFIVRELAEHAICG